MAIKHPKILRHEFLAEMYEDDYFPDALVDKGKAILVRLCEQIEAEKPRSLESLYQLTHAATAEFNTLAEEFAENDSEFETAARDAISSDFFTIAEAYGYDAKIRELVATREW